MKPNARHLNIGHQEGRLSFTLPPDIITQRGTILGRTGSGKTYVLMVIAEEMNRLGLPFVLTDPNGVCWGLRSSADGKGDGCPVVIFGGEHADLPLEEGSGTVIADWIVAERRSSVLDLSLLGSKAAERRFVADFADRLFRTNRAPLLVMIDEIDVYAPQLKEDKGDNRVLGTIITLARRGRTRGIGLLGATQRPASLNKNVLTQTEMLVALRISSPQDRAAIESWIEHHGTKEDQRNVLGSLGKLPIGEAWFWSPAWLDGLFRVHVRRRTTFDSSATPEVGAPVVKPRMSPIQLEKVAAEMQATIERAEADDPKKLRARIAELERQLKARPAAAPERVEVPVINRGMLDRCVDVKLAVGELQRAADEAAAHVRRMVGAMATLKQRADDAHELAKLPPGEKSATVRAIEAHLARTSARPTSKPNGATKLVASKLPEGERVILTACAQRPDGCTREQLTVLTGYKRSSRDSYIQRLRAKHLLEQNAGILLATSEGLAELGDWEPLPTGDALRDYWVARLTGGECELFVEIIKAYPRSLKRDELGKASGYQRSSRDSYLQRLGARKLITTPCRGEVRASEELFG